MPHEQDGREAAQVGRLLAGAAEAIARVRYCWLETMNESGSANARPMGRLPPESGEEPWTIRFLADGRSRKVSDIRHDGKVKVIFQHDASDTYARASGEAALQEDPSEVRRRWKRAYEVYFPGENDRANAIFVEIAVERLELWIRGVTPEPFGLQPTILARGANGAWRLCVAGRGAPPAHPEGTRP